MLKRTLIITSAVLATALILSGVSVADDNTARGHGLTNAQAAASKHGVQHGLQGRCNAASHQGIPLSGPLSVCAPPPAPTTESPPPPMTEPPPPPMTEPPPPPRSEPPPPNGL